MQKIQWTEGSQDFNPNVRLSFFFSLWKWAVIKTASAMLKLLKGEKWTGQKSASTAYFTWGWVEWLVFFVSHSPLHWVFCFMQGSIFTWRPISSWKIKKQVLRGEGQDSKTLKLSHFFCQSLISPSRMGTFSVWRMPGGWFYFFFCAAVLRESWCVTPVQNQKYVWHKT